MIRVESLLFRPETGEKQRTVQKEKKRLLFMNKYHRETVRVFIRSISKNNSNRVAMDINEGFTTIDFNHDWLCFRQSSTDQIDEKQIVTDVNTLDVDQRWSPIHLPHAASPKEQPADKPYKWWYRKRFDWMPSVEQDAKQKIYLAFQPTNDRPRSSNLDASLWLNGVLIIRDASLLQQDSIALSSKYLRRNDGDTNQLIIRCVNTLLDLDVRLLIRGRVVCATGQVEMNESCLDRERRQNDRLNYMVTMDDTDGRISVNFNPKRLTKTRSLMSTSSLTTDEKQSEGNKEDLDDDVLLVPRLAIVILIVGTRGDVQPFIA